MLDYPNGSNIIEVSLQEGGKRATDPEGGITAEAAERQREGWEDDTLLSLKPDDGATSQRIQEDS